MGSIILAWIAVVGVLALIGGIIAGRLLNAFLGLVAGLGVILVGFVFFLFLKPYGYVDNYELGYIWDARTGQISTLNRTGYVPRTPFLQTIYTIDTRPQQVCITADTAVNSGVNARVLNCKLVAFNPKGLGLFLKFHGANDYSGETLKDLLKIYAYDGSGTSYPFITVMNELKGQTQTFATPAVNTAPVADAAANTVPVGNVQ